MDELRIDDEVLDAWSERATERAREDRSDGREGAGALSAALAAVEAAAKVSQKYGIDALVPVVDAINASGTGFRLDVVCLPAPAGDKKESDKCQN